MMSYSKMTTKCFKSTNEEEEVDFHRFPPEAETIEKGIIHKGVSCKKEYLPWKFFLPFCKFSAMSPIHDVKLGVDYRFIDGQHVSISKGSIDWFPYGLNPKTLRIKKTIRSFHSLFLIAGLIEKT